MSTQAGGAATTYGIRYQMLGSLLELCDLHLTRCVFAKGSQDIEDASITLEPTGGGGDLVLEIDKRERIQQYKARTTGAAWSMRELVNVVLPDLYKAVRPGQSQVFQFVTEGHCGRWEEVDLWFQELRERPQPRTYREVLDSLSDSRLLSFGGSLRGDSETSRLSERELFVAIVESLIKSKVVRKKSTQEAYLRTWHLLSRFEGLWHQSAGSLRESLIKRLLPLVEQRERVEEKLDSLLQSVTTEASKGGVRLTAKDFLRKNGLDAVAIGQWPQLVANGRRFVSRSFKSLNYDPLQDVRSSSLDPEISAWLNSDNRCLVITGESGKGKTWSLGAMADHVSQYAPAVLLRSRGQAFVDKAEFERIVSQHICQRDSVLTLESIEERVRREATAHSNEWLFLCLDNVTSSVEAAHLRAMLAPLDGIRLVMSMLKAEAETFTSMPGVPVATYASRSFNLNELRLYLSNAGAPYPRESSIVELIRLPLLASLYREIGQSQWSSTSEYELYNTYFEDRVARRLRSDSPTRLPLLRKAVLSVWDGAPYPWTIEQLSEIGFDDQGITSLVQSGWWTAEPGERYRIWHDRLLQWQVAEALSRELETGARDSTPVATRWLEILTTESASINQSWGFVPMDLVWQLSRGGKRSSEALNEILAIAEGDYRLEQVLYEDLLKTIGEAIVPAVLRRVDETKSPNDQSIRPKMTALVASYDRAESTQASMAFIQSENWQVRRSGYEFFEQRPSAKALDRLWSRYVQLETDRTTGYEARADEPADNFWESRDVYKALAACVPQNPSWIEQKLEDASLASEQVATLLGFLRLLPDGTEDWAKLREVYVARLQGDDEATRALNAYQFSDVTEIEWLRNGVAREESRISWACMRALARVETKVALDALPSYPASELYLTRNTVLRDLLAHEPLETNERIAKLVADNTEARWNYASSYVDHPNFMSPQCLNTLLDDLGARMPSGSVDRLWNLFQPLAEITSPILLDELRKRANTDWGNQCADMIISKGPVPSYYSNATLEYVVAVLAKVGGPGLTRLVNYWLALDEPSTIRDAVDLAAICPDSETIQELRRVSQKLESVRGWEPGSAAKVLGTLGEWRHVIDYLILRHKEANRDIVNSRLNLGPLENTDLQPALDAFRENPTNPGAIMALGLAQRTEFTDQIASLLESEGTVEDTVNACLWAMFMMPELTPDARRAVGSRAKGPNDWVEISVLFKDGSNESVAKLVEILERNYGREVPSPVSVGNIHTLTRIAKRALRSPDFHDRAVRICTDLIERAPKLNSYATDLLRSISMSAKWHPEYRPVLEAPRAKDYLFEVAFRKDQSFRLVTEKLAAIRAVAQLSPKDGLNAVLEGFRDSTFHDREFLPYELSDLDAPRGQMELFNLLVGESSLVMRFTMARALVQDADLDWIAVQLRDPDPRVRRAAVLVLGHSTPSSERIAQLVVLLGDSDTEVYEEVCESLIRLYEAENALSIVREFMSEQNPQRKRILLLATLESGDPGDINRGIPDWFQPIWEVEPWLVRDECDERFAKRQEELRKDLESRDRRRQL